MSSTILKRALVGLLLLVPLVGTSTLAPRAHAALSTAVFYTTSGAGQGLPNGAEIFAIQVSGRTVTTQDIGPTYGGDCASLALASSGTLYSMCGPLFGAQQLATIDRTTGRATLFGTPRSGLAVMALAFAPNGTLYAVGDCNPDLYYECLAGSDPHFNSLYTVNVQTGAFTPVGATGAPQFFMDLASKGGLYGVTATDNPSSIPAILYRLNRATGTATKVVTLVGSTTVMGLAFGPEGQLYATDYAQPSHLYRIDRKTGGETTLATLPFGSSSSLEWAHSGDDGDDD